MDERRARRSAKRRFPERAHERAQFETRPFGSPGAISLRRPASKFEDGEFIGMLGANGAGKTTLMRAALGLTPLTSGTIAVFDQNVQRGNSSIGYMPQNRGAIASVRGSRLRHRRQRRARRAFRLRPSRQSDATRNRLGARPGRRERSWRAARSASSRAASASACS